MKRWISWKVTEASSESTKPKTKSSSTAYSKKKKEQSKKELAVLIGKTVHKAVKKQLASTDKKRKSDDECFLAEALTKDLDGFNYEAMENLNIDDDEVSC